MRGFLNLSSSSLIDCGTPCGKMNELFQLTMPPESIRILEERSGKYKYLDPPKLTFTVTAPRGDMRSKIATQNSPQTTPNLIKHHKNLISINFGHFKKIQNFRFFLLLSPSTTSLHHTKHPPTHQKLPPIHTKNHKHTLKIT